jgi:hypothetical protein
LLRWQKLAAQPVLLFSSGTHDMPNAHITKADRIWWAVRMKIIGGGCQQELYDCGIDRLGFTARDWSRAAGCEN